MRKRVSIFASLKKIHLGLNAVRGWVEGGMDDVALPFERCLKVDAHAGHVEWVEVVCHTLD